MNRWRGKAVAVLIGAAGLTWLTTGAAQAHVRVSAPQAVVGKPTAVDFRVPSEEQVATTIRLSITVPADVTVKQVPAVTGWMNVMAKDTAGDTVITWTAQGGGLAPAQAADFLVDVGALPNHPTLSSDVVQTYSNGDVVYWNQPQTGPIEPPFPAPTLKLAGGTSGAVPDLPSLTPATSTTPSTPAKTPEVTTAAATAPAGTPGWAVGLAIAGGCVLGAAATATAVNRRRRPPAQARR
jgi:uncharacterized protein YcnI